MQPERPEAIATLRGHKGSVKSVQFRPHSRCELVSGARGGDIILWDTRVQQGGVSALSNTVSVHLLPVALLPTRRLHYSTHKCPRPAKALCPGCAC